MVWNKRDIDSKTAGSLEVGNWAEWCAKQLKQNSLRSKPVKNKDAAFPNLSHSPSRLSLSSPVSFSLCRTNTACQNNLILKTNTSIPTLPKSLPTHNWTLLLFSTSILTTWTAKLPPREKPALGSRFCRCFFSFVSPLSCKQMPPLFWLLAPSPPLFMLIKSSDTEQQHRSQRPRRRHPDKSCHKCWSQNNWWIRVLKPRVSQSSPLRGKLFSRFLFTRLSGWGGLYRYTLLAKNTEV